MYMYLGPCAHFLADMNDVVVFSTYLNIHVQTFKNNYRIANYNYPW